jgi:hypothetical protein
MHQKVSLAGQTSTHICAVCWRALQGSHLRDLALVREAVAPYAFPTKAWQREHLLARDEFLFVARARFERNCRRAGLRYNICVLSNRSCIDCSTRVDASCKYAHCGINAATTGCAGTREGVLKRPGTTSPKH